jgi:hypothetical protein
LEIYVMNAYGQLTVCGGATSVGAITPSNSFHIRRNLTTGLIAGKQESFGTLVLSESGDEFTTDGHTIVYSVDGIPGTLNCSNSVGTRFKLEP